MGAGPGKGPSEVGLSKGLTAPGGGGAVEGVAAADGPADGLVVPRGLGPVIVVGVESDEVGVEFGRDATFWQREEVFTCRKFAGPQPHGVIASTTASMIIRVTIVTTTATAMRWVRVPGIAGNPLRGSMLRKS